MIKHTSLLTAIYEAERFLKRAKHALETHRKATEVGCAPARRLSSVNRKHNGAVRRSSLDLTQALVDLRARERG